MDVKDKDKQTQEELESFNERINNNPQIKKLIIYGGGLMLLIIVINITLL